MNWRPAIWTLLSTSICSIHLAHAQFEIDDDDYIYEKRTTSPTTAIESDSSKMPPSYGLGGIGQVTIQNSAPPVGASNSTFRGQLRLDGWVGLGENRCFKLQARLTTGNKFNSESVVSSAFDAQPTFSIGLRRLYIDTNCVRDNVRLQVGSTPSDSAGKLGLSSSGWIDGARIIVDDVENNRKLTLSLGNISNLETARISEREYSGRMNYIQIEGVQILNGGHDVFASVSSYKDDMYTRLGIKWAISEYINWLQNIRGEVLFLNTKSSGYYLGVEAEVERWRVNAYMINLEPSLQKSVDVALVLNSFYGVGRNFYFELARPLDENWTFYFRNREGQAGRKTETGINRKF